MGPIISSITRPDTAPKPIRAVVFDRDGVLTEFDLGAARAFFRTRLPIELEELMRRWQRWGETVGWPRSAHEEATFWREFWDMICREFEVHSAIRDELHTFGYTSVVKPYADARPAMAYARQRGLRIGVLSNFTLASLDASLAATGLAGLVDVACAATVIGASKPDPRSYAAVLQRLHVTADETLYIDDELPCVEGARAIGMHAYLLDRSSKLHSIHDGVIGDLHVLRTLLAESDA